MGVLLILLSIGGVIAAVIVAIIALVTKKSWLLKFTFAAVVVWFCSTGNAGRIFGRKHRKGIGLKRAESILRVLLDCHLHTAVTVSGPQRRLAAWPLTGLFA
jgi:hypothetical protein